MKEDFDYYMNIMEATKPYDPNLSDILGDDFNDTNGDMLTSDLELELMNKAKKSEDDSKYKIHPMGKTKIEEELVHFKRFNTRRVHKYTEKEMQEIRNSCLNTIVHDYGDNDIYHMTDEERKEGDILADIRLKLGTLHRSYSRVDEYIEAMRTVVKAWEILEQYNYLDTEEEFFNKVAEGKIVSNSIMLPKLKKINQYNMDLIIMYISNPELDPSDLVPKGTEDTDTFYDQFDDDRNSDNLSMERKLYWYYYDLYLYNKEQEFYAEYGNDEEWQHDVDDELEASNYAADEVKKERMARLLSIDELKLISDDSPLPDINIKDVKKKYIEGYDERDIDRRLKKKMNKNERLIARNLHSILRSIEDDPNMRPDEYDRSSIITDSMFNVNKEKKDIFDEMRYTGSWANEETVDLYNFAIREELLRQHIPGSSYITYADKELAKFFDTLESNGVNTVELRRNMNCTVDQMKEAENKHTKKENKKIEAEILARVIKANGDPTFKKLAAKAEEKLNKYNEGKYDD